MGLREKVTLTLVIIALIQIACRHCMPRSPGKSSLKRYLNNLKTHKNNPVPLTNSPSRSVHKTPKQTFRKSTQNVRNSQNSPPKKSLYQTYNFPENEFPLDNSPRNPFNFGMNFNANYQVNTPKKGSQYSQSSAINDFKKEIKMKRKLLSNRQKTNENNQPKREMTSIPFTSGYNSMSVLDPGTFPEVQYPLNTMETWTPNYWNYLRFTESESQSDGYGIQKIKPKVIEDVKKPFARLTKTSQLLKSYDKIKEEQKHISTENSKRSNVGHKGLNFTKTATSERVSDDFITAGMVSSIPENSTDEKKTLDSTKETKPSPENTCHIKEYLYHLLPIPYKVIEEDTEIICPASELNTKELNELNNSVVTETLESQPLQDIPLSDDISSILTVLPGNFNKDVEKDTPLFDCINVPVNQDIPTTDTDKSTEYVANYPSIELSHTFSDAPVDIMQNNLPKPSAEIIGNTTSAARPSNDRITLQCNESRPLTNVPSPYLANNSTLSSGNTISGSTSIIIIPINNNAVDKPQSHIIKTTPDTQIIVYIPSSQSSDNYTLSLPCNQYVSPSLEETVPNNQLSKIITNMAPLQNDNPFSTAPVSELLNDILNSGSSLPMYEPLPNNSMCFNNENSPSSTTEKPSSDNPIHNSLTHISPSTIPTCNKKLTIQPTETGTFGMNTDIKISTPDFEPPLFDLADSDLTFQTHIPCNSKLNNELQIKQITDDSSKNQLALDRLQVGKMLPPIETLIDSLPLHKEQTLLPTLNPDNLPQDKVDEPFSITATSIDSLRPQVTETFLLNPVYNPSIDTPLQIQSFSSILPIDDTLSFTPKLKVTSDNRPYVINNLVTPQTKTVTSLIKEAPTSRLPVIIDDLPSKIDLECPNRYEFSVNDLPLIVDQKLIKDPSKSVSVNDFTQQIDKIIPTPLFKNSNSMPNSTKDSFLVTKEVLSEVVTPDPQTDSPILCNVPSDGCLSTAVDRLITPAGQIVPDSRLLGISFEEIPQEYDLPMSVDSIADIAAQSQARTKDDLLLPADKYNQDLPLSYALTDESSIDDSLLPVNNEVFKISPSIADPRELTPLLVGQLTQESNASPESLIRTILTANSISLEQGSKTTYPDKPKIDELSESTDSSVFRDDLSLPQHNVVSHSGDTIDDHPLLRNTTPFDKKLPLTKALLENVFFDITKEDFSSPVAKSLPVLLQKPHYKQVEFPLAEFKESLLVPVDKIHVDTENNLTNPVKKQNTLLLAEEKTLSNVSMLNIDHELPVLKDELYKEKPNVVKDVTDKNVTPLSINIHLNDTPSAVLLPTNKAPPTSNLTVTKALLENVLSDINTRGFSVSRTVTSPSMLDKTHYCEESDLSDISRDSFLLSNDKRKSLPSEVLSDHLTDDVPLMVDNSFLAVPNLVISTVSSPQMNDIHHVVPDILIFDHEQDANDNPSDENKAAKDLAQEDNIILFPRDMEDELPLPKDKIPTSSKIIITKALLDNVLSDIITRGHSLPRFNPVPSSSVLDKANYNTESIFSDITKDSSSLPIDNILTTAENLDYPTDTLPLAEDKPLADVPSLNFPTELSSQTNVINSNIPNFVVCDQNQYNNKQPSFGSPTENVLTVDDILSYPNDVPSDLPISKAVLENVLSDVIKKGLPLPKSVSNTSPLLLENMHYSKETTHSDITKDSSPLLVDKILYSETLSNSPNNDVPLAVNQRHSDIPKSSQIKETRPDKPGIYIYDAEPLFKNIHYDPLPVGENISLPSDFPGNPPLLNDKTPSSLKIPITKAILNNVLSDITTRGFLLPKSAPITSPAVLDKIHYFSESPFSEITTFLPTDIILPDKAQSDHRSDDLSLTVDKSILDAPSIDFPKEFSSQIDEIYPDMSDVIVFEQEQDKNENLSSKNPADDLSPVDDIRSFPNNISGDIPIAKAVLENVLSDITTRGLSLSKSTLKTSPQLLENMHYPIESPHSNITNDSTPLLVDKILSSETLSNSPNNELSLAIDQTISDISKSLHIDETRPDILDIQIYDEKPLFKNLTDDPSPIGEIPSIPNDNPDSQSLIKDKIPSSSKIPITKALLDNVLSDISTRGFSLPKSVPVTSSAMLEKTHYNTKTPFFDITKDSPSRPVEKNLISPGHFNYPADNKPSTLDKPLLDVLSSNFPTEYSSQIDEIHSNIPNTVVYDQEQEEKENPSHKIATVYLSPTNEIIYVPSDYLSDFSRPENNIRPSYSKLPITKSLLENVLSEIIARGISIPTSNSVIHKTNYNTASPFSTISEDSPSTPLDEILPSKTQSDNPKDDLPLEENKSLPNGPSIVLPADLSSQIKELYLNIPDILVVSQDQNNNEMRSLENPSDNLPPIDDIFSFPNDMLSDLPIAKAVLENVLSEVSKNSFSVPKSVSNTSTPKLEKKNYYTKTSASDITKDSPLLLVDENLTSKPFSDFPNNELPLELDSTHSNFLSLNIRKTSSSSQTDETRPDKPNIRIHEEIKNENLSLKNPTEDSCYLLPISEIISLPNDFQGGSQLPNNKTASKSSKIAITKALLENVISDITARGILLPKSVPVTSPSGEDKTQYNTTFSKVNPSWPVDKILTTVGYPNHQTNSLPFAEDKTLPDRPSSVFPTELISEIKDIQTEIPDTIVSYHSQNETKNSSKNPSGDISQMDEILFLSNDMPGDQPLPKNQTLSTSKLLITKALLENILSDINTRGSSLPLSEAVPVSSPSVLDKSLVYIELPLFAINKESPTLPLDKIHLSKALSDIYNDNLPAHKKVSASSNLDIPEKLPSLLDDVTGIQMLDEEQENNETPSLKNTKNDQSPFGEIYYPDDKPKNLPFPETKISSTSKLPMTKALLENLLSNINTRDLELPVAKSLSVTSTSVLDKMPLYIESPLSDSTIESPSPSGDKIDPSIALNTNENLSLAEDKILTKITDIPTDFLSKIDENGLKMYNILDEEHSKFEIPSLKNPTYDLEPISEIQYFPEPSGLTLRNSKTLSPSQLLIIKALLENVLSDINTKDFARPEAKSLPATSPLVLDKTLSYIESPLSDRSKDNHPSPGDKIDPSIALFDHTNEDIPLAVDKILTEIQDIPADLSTKIDKIHPEIFYILNEELGKFENPSVLNPTDVLDPISENHHFPDSSSPNRKVPTTSKLSITKALLENVLSDINANDFARPVAKSLPATSPSVLDKTVSYFETPLSDMSKDNHPPPGDKIDPSIALSDHINEDITPAVDKISTEIPDIPTDLPSKIDGIHPEISDILDEDHGKYKNPSLKNPTDDLESIIENYNFPDSSDLPSSNRKAPSASQLSITKALLENVLSDINANDFARPVAKSLPATSPSVLDKTLSYVKDPLSDRSKDNHTPPGDNIDPNIALFDHTNEDISLAADDKPKNLPFPETKISSTSKLPMTKALLENLLSNINTRDLALPVAKSLSVTSTSVLDKMPLYIESPLSDSTIESPSPSGDKIDPSIALNTNENLLLAEDKILTKITDIPTDFLSKIDENGLKMYNILDGEHSKFKIPSLKNPTYDLEPISEIQSFSDPSGLTIRNSKTLSPSQLLIIKALLENVLSDINTKDFARPEAKSLPATLPLVLDKTLSYIEAPLSNRSKDNHSPPGNKIDPSIALFDHTNEDISLAVDKNPSLKNPTYDLEPISEIQSFSDPSGLTIRNSKTLSPSQLLIIKALLENVLSDINANDFARPVAKYLPATSPSVLDKTVSYFETPLSDRSKDNHPPPGDKIDPSIALSDHINEDITLAVDKIPTEIQDIPADLSSKLDKIHPEIFYILNEELGKYKNPSLKNPTDDLESIIETYNFPDSSDLPSSNRKAPSASKLSITKALLENVLSDINANDFARPVAKSLPATSHSVLDKPVSYFETPLSDRSKDNHPLPGDKIDPSIALSNHTFENISLAVNKMLTEIPDIPTDFLSKIDENGPKMYNILDEEHSKFEIPSLKNLPYNLERISEIQSFPDPSGKTLSASQLIIIKALLENVLSDINTRDFPRPETKSLPATSPSVLDKTLSYIKDPLSDRSKDNHPHPGDKIDPSIALFDHTNEDIPLAVDKMLTEIQDIPADLLSEIDKIHPEIFYTLNEELGKFENPSVLNPTDVLDPISENHHFPDSSNLPSSNMKALSASKLSITKALLENVLSNINTKDFARPVAKSLSATSPSVLTKTLSYIETPLSDSSQENHPPLGDKIDPSIALSNHTIENISLAVDKVLTEIPDIPTDLSSKIDEIRPEISNTSDEEHGKLKNPSLNNPTDGLDPISENHHFPDSSDSSSLNRKAPSASKLSITKALLENVLSDINTKDFARPVAKYLPATSPSVLDNTLSYVETSLSDRSKDNHPPPGDKMDPSIAPFDHTNEDISLVVDKTLKEILNNPTVLSSKIDEMRPEISNILDEEHGKLKNPSLKNPTDDLELIIENHNFPDLSDSSSLNRKAPSTSKLSITKALLENVLSDINANDFARPVAKSLPATSPSVLDKTVSYFKTPLSDRSRDNHPPLGDKINPSIALSNYTIENISLAVDKKLTEIPDIPTDLSSKIDEIRPEISNISDEEHGKFKNPSLKNPTDGLDPISENHHFPDSSDSSSPNRKAPSTSKLSITKALLENVLSDINANDFARPVATSLSATLPSVLNKSPSKLDKILSPFSDSMRESPLPPSGDETDPSTALSGHPDENISLAVDKILAETPDIPTDLSFKIDEILPEIFNISDEEHGNFENPSLEYLTDNLESIIENHHFPDSSDIPSANSKAPSASKLSITKALLENVLSDINTRDFALPVAKSIQATSLSVLDKTLSYIESPLSESTEENPPPSDDKIDPSIAHPDHPNEDISLAVDEIASEILSLDTPADLAPKTNEIRPEIFNISDEKHCKFENLFLKKSANDLESKGEIHSPPLNDLVNNLPSSNRKALSASKLSVTKALLENVLSDINTRNFAMPVAKYLQATSPSVLDKTLSYVESPISDRIRPLPPGDKIDPTSMAVSDHTNKDISLAEDKTLTEIQDIPAELTSKIDKIHPEIFYILNEKLGKFENPSLKNPTDDLESIIENHNFPDSCDLPSANRKAPSASKLSITKALLENVLSDINTQEFALPVAKSLSATSPSVLDKTLSYIVSLSDSTEENTTQLGDKTDPNTALSDHPNENILLAVDKIPTQINSLDYHTDLSSKTYEVRPEIFNISDEKHCKFENLSLKKSTNDLESKGEIHYPPLNGLVNNLPSSNRKALSASKVSVTKALLENVLSNINTRDFALPVAKSFPVTSPSGLDKTLSFNKSPMSDSMKENPTQSGDKTDPNTVLSNHTVENISPAVDKILTEIPDIPTDFSHKIDEIRPEISNISDEEHGNLKSPSLKYPTDNLESTIENHHFPDSNDLPSVNSKAPSPSKLSITKALLENVLSDINTRDFALPVAKSLPATSPSVLDKTLSYIESPVTDSIEENPPPSDEKTDPSTAHSDHPNEDISLALDKISSDITSLDTSTDLAPKTNEIRPKIIDIPEDRNGKFKNSSLDNSTNDLESIGEIQSFPHNNPVGNILSLKSKAPSASKLSITKALLENVLSDINTKEFALPVAKSLSATSSSVLDKTLSYIESLSDSSEENTTQLGDKTDPNTALSDHLNENILLAVDKLPTQINSLDIPTDLSSKPYEVRPEIFNISDEKHCKFENLSLKKSTNDLKSKGEIHSLPLNDLVNNLPSSNRKALTASKLSVTKALLENVLTNINTRDFALPVAKSFPVTSPSVLDKTLSFTKSPMSDSMKENPTQSGDKTDPNTVLSNHTVENISPAVDKILTEIPDIPTDLSFKIDEIHPEISNISDEEHGNLKSPSLKYPTDNLESTIENHHFPDSNDLPSANSKAPSPSKLSITKALLENVLSDINTRDFALPVAKSLPATSPSVLDKTLSYIESPVSESIEENPPPSDEKSDPSTAHSDHPNEDISLAVDKISSEITSLDTSTDLAPKTNEIRPEIIDIPEDRNGKFEKSSLDNSTNDLESIGEIHSFPHNNPVGNLLSLKSKAPSASKLSVTKALLENVLSDINTRNFALPAAKSSVLDKTLSYVESPLSESTEEYPPPSDKIDPSIAHSDHPNEDMSLAVDTIPTEIPSLDILSDLSSKNYEIRPEISNIFEEKHGKFENPPLDNPTDDLKLIDNIHYVPHNNPVGNLPSPNSKIPSASKLSITKTLLENVLSEINTNGFSLPIAKPLPVASRLAVEKIPTENPSLDITTDLPPKNNEIRPDISNILDNEHDKFKHLSLQNQTYDLESKIEIRSFPDPNDLPSPNNKAPSASKLSITKALLENVLSNINTKDFARSVAKSLPATLPSVLDKMLSNNESPVSENTKENPLPSGDKTDPSIVPSDHPNEDISLDVNKIPTEINSLDIPTDLSSKTYEIRPEVLDNTDEQNGKFENLSLKKSTMDLEPIDEIHSLSHNNSIGNLQLPNSKAPSVSKLPITKALLENVLSEINTKGFSLPISKPFPVASRLLLDKMFYFLEPPLLDISKAKSLLPVGKMVSHTALFDNQSILPNSNFPHSELNEDVLLLAADKQFTDNPILNTPTNDLLTDNIRKDKSNIPTVDRENEHIHKTSSADGSTDHLTSQMDKKLSLTDDKLDDLRLQRTQTLATKLPETKALLAKVLSDITGGFSAVPITPRS